MEVLSQEDIDTLLTAISSGESEAYDILEPNTEVFVVILFNETTVNIYKGRVKSLLNLEQSHKFMRSQSFIYDIEYYNKSFNDPSDWGADFYSKIHNVKRTDIFKSYFGALQRKLEVLHEIADDLLSKYTFITSDIEDVFRLLNFDSLQCPSCFSGYLVNNVCNNCSVDFNTDLPNKSGLGK